MVCIAIVARLDTAHWMFHVASISRNSSKCLQKLNKSTVFREIDATWNIRCVGSRRATIAIQTILKTSESCGFSKKRIRELRWVFLTFLGGSNFKNMVLHSYVVTVFWLFWPTVYNKGWLYLIFFMFICRPNNREKESLLKYDRVIVLIRNPFDAFLAEFNRRKSKSHTGFASDQMFKKKWPHFFNYCLEYWKKFHLYYKMEYKPHQLLFVRVKEFFSEAADFSCHKRK